jgi:flagellar biosynthesis/type III secretory pathway protein FliH
MRRIEILDKGSLPGSGILRSTDFASISKSDDIIRNTQSWAAARRAEIEAKLQEERKATLTRAYEEGLSGFLAARDGYLEATHKLSEKLEFLLLKSLDRLLGTLPPKDLLQATLAPLIGDLERQGEVRLLVHPTQVAMLRTFLAERLSDPGAFAVMSDASLDEPDCVIFTQSEIITVSIPVLVEQLMTAMATYLELAVAAQREDSSDSPQPSDR